VPDERSIDAVTEEELLSGLEKLMPMEPSIKDGGGKSGEGV
jgi:hypothetical protein